MAFSDNLNDLHMMQVISARSFLKMLLRDLELTETVIGHHKDQSVIAYMEDCNDRYKLIALNLDGTLLTTDKN